MQPLNVIILNVRHFIKVRRICQRPHIVIYVLFQEKKIKVCQNCSKVPKFVLDLDKYFLPGKEYFLSETAFLPSVNIDEVVSVRI